MKSLAFAVLCVSCAVVFNSCKKETTKALKENRGENASNLASLSSGPSPNTLRIITVAGQPFHFGYADGPGSQAMFNYPLGIDLSEEGYLYVADVINDKIRKIQLSDNSVSTVSIPPAADGSTIHNPYVVRLARDGTLNIMQGPNMIWIVKTDGTVLTPDKPAANATLSPDIERDPSGNFFWIGEVDQTVNPNNTISSKAYLKKLYVNPVTNVVGSSPLTLNVNGIEQPDRSDFDILDFYPGYNGVKYVVINHTKLYALSSAGVFTRIYKDLDLHEIYSIVSSKDSRTIYLAESGQIKCIADGVHKFLAGPNPKYHDGRNGFGSEADIFAEKLALSKDENTLYFSDVNTGTIRKMQLK